MRRRSQQGSRPAGSMQPVETAFALPIGFSGVLVVAAAASAANGRIAAGWVLALVCVVVGVVSAVSEPLAAVPMIGIGWLTATSFSRPPYAHLQTTHAIGAALALAATAAGCVVVGAGVRAVLATSGRYVQLTAGDESTIDVVTTMRLASWLAAGVPWGRPPSSLRDSAARDELAAGIGSRRMVGGFALAGLGLPILTAVLAAVRPHLALVDDLLLYLAAVVGVTLVGGFWPAVVAALASSLLLNWFFTPPVHTWTIDTPQNLLALLLFVTVAVTVSSVVHLAARRAALATHLAALATHLAAESSTLLQLARTVLGGDDSPSAVLEHLASTIGHPAELLERVGERWVRVAGTAATAEAAYTVRPREDLELRIYGVQDKATRLNARVFEGFAAQAAAALDRERLRVQASQAEALDEGNRMRTALLAAVSHDLRTPLASVKASVSTLRQTDVSWSPGDQAELLATIEEGADRLNALIGNLLDMSRIQTGAVQLFIRPTALDEVAPVVVRSLDDAETVHFDIPEDLPLVAADPGLLERALANLVSNALRYSPAGRPPTLAATATGETVTIAIVDHGPGVADSQRELMLQPFQQLGDQRSAGGVGLGLAVAKGFVEAMGGRLQATSTPGGGLTMCVELPTSATSDDRAAPAAAQP